MSSKLAAAVMALAVVVILVPAGLWSGSLAYQGAPEINETVSHAEAEPFQPVANEYVGVPPDYAVGWDSNTVDVDYENGSEVQTAEYTMNYSDGTILLEPEAVDGSNITVAGTYGAKTEPGRGLKRAADAGVLGFSLLPIVVGGLAVMTVAGGAVALLVGGSRSGGGRYGKW